MNLLYKSFIITLLIPWLFSIELFYTKVIKQGEINTILVRTKKKSEPLEVVYGNKTIPLYNIYYSPDKFVYRAIIGTDPLTNPGEKTIKIIKNNETLKTATFLVTQDAFQKEYIEIPKEKQPALTNENLVNEGNIIGSKFKTVSKPALWKEKFIMPAEGRISSPYGSQRKYNKDNIAWWHKGVDIANKIGTPVLAPNDGEIILIDSLAVHGKTIMIDHGHNLISVFNHLDTILVKTGDFVKKGSLVGKMGNTGNSTGPHLHWGLSINNVRVNPLHWVEKKLAPNYF